MARTDGRFAVRWEGKVYKALRITRTSNCIVISLPCIPLHTTYPSNGRVHYTIEKPMLEITGENTLKIVIGREQRIYTTKLPPLNEVKGRVYIGTFGGFSEECKSLSISYELIDLDTLKISDPNMFCYLIPPVDEELEEINRMHRGEIRVVKFENVWAVVAFVDAMNP